MPNDYFSAALASSYGGRYGQGYPSLYDEPNSEDYLASFAPVGRGNTGLTSAFIGPKHNDEDPIERAAALGRAAAYADSGKPVPNAEALRREGEGGFFVAPGPEFNIPVGRPKLYDPFAYDQSFHAPQKPFDPLNTPEIKQLTLQRGELSKTEQLYKQRVTDFDRTEGAKLKKFTDPVTGATFNNAFEPDIYRLEAAVKTNPGAAAQLDKIKRDQLMLLDKRKRLVDEASRVTDARNTFDENVYMPARQRLLLPETGRSQFPNFVGPLRTDSSDWSADQQPDFLGDSIAGNAPAPGQQLESPYPQEQQQEDMYAPGGSADVGPTAPPPPDQPPDTRQSPMDLIRMKKKADEYRKTLEGAGNNLDQRVRDRLTREAGVLDQGFKQGFDQLEPAMRQRVSDITRDPTLGEKFAAGVGNVLGGAAESLVDVPKFVGRQFTRADNAVRGGLNDAGGNYEDINPDDNAYQNFLSNMQEAAQGWGRNFDSISPEVMDKIQSGTMVGQVAPAVGGLAGMLLPGGMMGRNLSRGAQLITNEAMGSASAANRMRDEARAAGADADTQDNSEEWGAALGLSLAAAAPLGNFISRVIRTGPGKVFGTRLVKELSTGGPAAGKEFVEGAGKPWLERAIDTMGESAGFGLQQAAQKLGENVLQTYDPKRPAMQGVDTAAISGAFLGALSRGTRELYQGVASRNRWQIPPEAPPTNPSGSPVPDGGPTADLPGGAQPLIDPELAQRLGFESPYENQSGTGEGTAGESRGGENGITGEGTGRGADRSGASGSTLPLPAAGSGQVPGASHGPTEGVLPETAGGEGLVPQGPLTPFVFVSSNTESLDLPTAASRLSSEPQQQFEQLVQGMAPGAKVRGGVGFWKDTAENSLMARLPEGSTIEDARRVAAQAGMSAKQIQAMYGQLDPNGKSALWVVHFPENVSIEQAQKIIRGAGLTGAHLEPGNSGITALVFDEHLALGDNLARVAEHESQPTISRQPANGGTVGDPAGQSADAAREQYARALQPSDEAMGGDQGSGPVRGVRDLRSQPAATATAGDVVRGRYSQSSPGDLPLGGEILPAAVGGAVDLVHYSGRDGLTAIDPSYFGKGSANTTDLKGGNKSYYYVDGSDFGQDASLFNVPGKVAYGARVSGNRIYDLNADPLNTLGEPNREARDAMLKKAGYAGMAVTTQDGRRVVAMFEPVKVTSQPPEGKQSTEITPSSVDNPAVEPKTPSFGDRAIAALSKAKMLPAGATGAHTPLSLAWDSAIDTAILAIKAGQKIGDVVQAAIAHFREKFPGAEDQHVARLQRTIQTLAGQRDSIDEPPQPDPTVDGPVLKHVETLRGAGVPIDSVGRDVVGNDVSRQAARDYIAKHGEATAIDRVMRGEPDIAPGADTMVLTEAERGLNEQLKKAPATDRQAILDRLVTLSTAAGRRGMEQGRQVQALNEINRWGPGGIIRAAVEQTQQARNQVIGTRGQKALGGAVQKANEINADAAGQIADELVSGRRRISTSDTAAIEREAAAQGNLDPTAKKALLAAKEIENQKARLPQQPVTKTIWDQYKQQAANQLLNTITSREASPDGTPPLQDPFVKSLVSEITNQINEVMPPPETAGAAPRPAIEQIADAIKNPEKYQEVWQKVRENLAAKYADDPDTLEKIDDALVGVLDKPYSKRSLDKAIGEAFKQTNTKLADVVRQHYTVAQTLGSSLAQKLVDQAGLKGPQAEQLANQIQQRVGEMTAERKQTELQKYAQQIADSSTKKISTKQLTQRLVDSSNLGALHDDTFLQTNAKALGLPTLEPEQATKLQDLAEKIQSAPEGRIRNERITDALTELKRMQGTGTIDTATSIYYAHILSGYTTQAMNIISTATNTAADLGLLAVTNPGKIGHLLTGMAEGVGEGFRQAGHTLATGYSDKGLLSKSGNAVTMANDNQPMPTLEILANGQPKTIGGKVVKGYSNIMKMVGRGMRAADTVFFETAKSAFDHVAAVRLAEEASGGKMDRATLNKKVRTLLQRSPSDFEAARQQATAEGQTGLDNSLRVSDILRQQRAKNLGPDEARNSQEFGLEATFNQKPQGALGIVADGVGKMAQKLPALKLVVPFTNIVANVANNSINYSPIGLKRGAFGMTGGEKPSGSARDLLLAKGLVGTAGMIGGIIWALNQGDKEQQPRITGAGPRDKGQRDQLRATGWMPYSIKIGDKYVSYLPTPAALPAAIIGNLADRVHYDKLGTKQTGAMLKDALLSVPETMTNQTFLQGLSQLMAAARGESGAWGQLAQSTVGSVIPNGVQQIDRAFDPTIYQSEGPQDLLLSRVPGARQQLNPQLDVRGRPVQSNPLERFGRSAKDDELAQVLAEKQAWIPAATRPTLGPIGHKTPVSDEDYYSYQQEVGRAVNERLTALLPTLRVMPPERAKAMVDLEVSRIHDAAKRRLSAVRQLPN